MKIAFPIDDFLCDTASLKEEWFKMEGDLKFLDDAVFWAALKPYDDVRDATPLLAKLDLYVFAERPKAVFLPTRAWFRNITGYELGRDRLIMQAIKRYDCRMLGIDAFLDTDRRALENLKIETVRPIRPYLLDREMESLPQLLERVHDEGMCVGP